MATLKITGSELTDLAKSMKEKAKQELQIGREPNKEDAPYRERPPGGPPWPGYPNPPPPGWVPPVKLAGLADDLKIDPTAHKGAQKKTKIYNKATQGSGSEKDWLKKTGPQLPLADSRTLRDHLKPYTKGVRGYDSQGGSLRGVPDKLRKDLLIQGVSKYQA